MSATSTQSRLRQKYGEVRCGCVARESAHWRIPLNVGWPGLNLSTRGTGASTCLRRAESENLTRTQAHFWNVAEVLRCTTRRVLTLLSGALTRVEARNLVAWLLHDHRV